MRAGCGWVGCRPLNKSDRSFAIGCRVDLELEVCPFDRLADDECVREVVFNQQECQRLRRVSEQRLQGR